MITFKEYIAEGYQEMKNAMDSIHPDKRASFRKHYSKARQTMPHAAALQYTHNLMKEETELDEVTSVLVTKAGAKHIKNLDGAKLKAAMKRITASLVRADTKPEDRKGTPNHLFHDLERLS